MVLSSLEEERRLASSSGGNRSIETGLEGAVVVSLDGSLRLSGGDGGGEGSLSSKDLKDSVSDSESWTMVTMVSQGRDGQQAFVEAAWGMFEVKGTRTFRFSEAEVNVQECYGNR